jgi:rhodanese-related sulfurtransferase
MTTKLVSPTQAQNLIAHGAMLIDIREADEWRREHIGLATLRPLSTLHTASIVDAGQLIFQCKSGNRTLANAAKLTAAAPGCDVYLLDGGLDAWRGAGLPTIKDVRQPIEIMRQVQIAAGALVALGVALGVLVHPGFLGLAGFVGVGLMFAGVTGFCGMAKLLARAPWNRAAMA